MNSALTAAMASTLIDERIRDAEQERRAHVPGIRPEEPYSCVTVRLATRRDDGALRRLEHLEGRRLPYEPTLVAEVEGRILAARTLPTRQAIADPFRPTQPLVEMLDLRSLQLASQNGHTVRGAGVRRHRVRRFARTLTIPIRPSSYVRNGASRGPC